MTSTGGFSDRAQSPPRPSSASPMAGDDCAGFSGLRGYVQVAWHRWAGGSAGGAAFTRCRPPRPRAVMTASPWVPACPLGFVQALTPGPQALLLAVPRSKPVAGMGVSDRNWTCVCSRPDSAAECETPRDGGCLIMSDRVTPSALTHGFRPRALGNGCRVLCGCRAWAWPWGWRSGTSVCGSPLEGWAGKSLP